MRSRRDPLSFVRLAKNHCKYYTGNGRTALQEGDRRNERNWWESKTSTATPIKPSSSGFMEFLLAVVPSSARHRNNCSDTSSIGLSIPRAENHIKNSLGIHDCVAVVLCLSLPAQDSFVPKTCGQSATNEHYRDIMPG